MDKSGNTAVGTFYYPTVDIDVNRGTGPNTNFSNFYNSDVYNNYSEQVLLKSGLASPVFIPGGDYVDGVPGSIRYRSNIEQTNGGLLFYPGTTDDNTFYSGFATLVNNIPSGLDMSLWAAGYTGGVETYILTGYDPNKPNTQKINHKIKASTGLGGNIETTRNGNHDGTLLDGSVVMGTNIQEGVEDHTITVATGQTVVYTMKPQPGYTLSSVTVNRSGLDYSQGQVISPEERTDVNGEKYWIFEFSRIANDGSIHVEWQPSTDVQVIKVWDDYDDFQGLRPEQIKVQLKQDGVDFRDPVIIEASDNWQYTFTDLPKYKNFVSASDNGGMYAYSVEEINVPLYYIPTVTLGTDSPNTITITNTVKLIENELPATGGAGLPILIKLALGSISLTPAVSRIKRKWGVGS